MAAQATTPDPDAPARFVLHYLIGRHPTLLSMDELVREFSRASEEPGKARVYVEDGIGDLAGRGLVNRLGDYVFASHAAMGAYRLLDT